MDRNLPWWNYPRKSQGLETLVRRYSTPQQLAGRIILSRGWPEQQPNSWAWMIRYGSGATAQAAILEDLSIEERLRDALS